MEINNYNEDLPNIESSDVKNDVGDVFELTKNDESVREPETGEDSSTANVNKEKKDDLKDLKDKLDNANGSDTSSSSASSGGAGAGAGVGAAAAAVGAAAIVVVMVATSVSGFNVSFKDTVANGTSIDYALDVEMEYVLSEDEEASLLNFNNVDTGLRLVVYNNDYSNSVSLVIANEEQSGENWTSNSEVGQISMKDETTCTVPITFKGNVSGLNTNTRYKMNVIGEKDGGGTKTYCSQTVKTLGKTTNISGIAYQCKCQIDGNFYFTLNFVDENDYYDDFNFALSVNENNAKYLAGIYELGSVLSSGAMTNPHAQQVVPGALEMDGTYYDLTITFCSTAPTDFEKIGSEETIDGMLFGYSQYVDVLHPEDATNKTLITMKTEVKL